jgi:hypothetical protein
MIGTESEGIMNSGSVAIRPGGSDDQLRLLARWLRDEDALRGRVSLAEKPISDGQMGGALDAVLVLLTSATASTFVSSLFDWLKHRKDAGRVSLKVRNEVGRELELVCDSADDVERVVESVRTFLGDGE